MSKFKKALKNVRILSGISLDEINDKCLNTVTGRLRRNPFNSEITKMGLGFGLGTWSDAPTSTFPQTTAISIQLSETHTARIESTGAYLQNDTYLTGADIEAIYKAYKTIQ